MATIGKPRMTDLNVTPQDPAALIRQGILWADQARMIMLSGSFDPRGVDSMTSLAQAYAQLAQAEALRQQAGGAS